MTAMRVWQANHPDGSPWKIWAACIEGNRLITRWGAAGGNLKKPTEVDLKIATPSARLSQLEREKETGSSRYKYLGTFEVTEEGEILDSAPKGPDAVDPAPPPGFYTATTEFNRSAIARVCEVFEIDWREEGNILVLGKDSWLTWTIQQQEISTGVLASKMDPDRLMAMAYLAKAGGGVLVGPKGEPIELSYEGVKDLFPNGKTEALRDKAEKLGLAAKHLSKLLKTRSGLFSFGSINQPGSGG